MSKQRIFSMRFLGSCILVLVLILGWSTIYADDFYVVAVGKKATGDATVNDVLKGKTFSNSSATGLVGARPPAPVEKTGQTYSSRSGDDGNLQKGVAWPNPRFSAGTYVATDNLTKLMWQKSPATVAKPWSSAIDDCNGLTIYEPTGTFTIIYQCKGTAKSD